MGLCPCSKCLLLLICVWSTMYLSGNGESDLCMEQIEPITDCWLHYSDPPSCNGRSSMVICAQEKYDLILNCSDETMAQIHRVVDSYGIMEDIWCGHKELHDLIDKRKPCWPVTRSCALQVLMVPEDNAEELCGNAMSIVQVCKILNDGCADVHLSYMNEVIGESYCKDAVQASTECDIQASFTSANTDTDNSNGAAATDLMPIDILALCFSSLISIMQLKM